MMMMMITTSLLIMTNKTTMMTVNIITAVRRGTAGTLAGPSLAPPLCVKCYWYKCVAL